MTEPADRIERSIERRAADRVVDDVEATPAGVYGNVVFDRHLTIVDCNRAKPLDESLAGGRSGREYLGAEAAGDLDSDVANAAGASMDQYLLTGMHRRAIDQSFPRRDEDQRESRGFTHGEIGGFWCEQIGIDNRVFRQRALQTANTAGHSIDFVSVPKAGHARTDGLDDARKIDAENGRQRLARVSGLAGPNLDVERVDRAGFDPDQNLPRLRIRLSDPRNPERCAMAVENRGLHGFRCCHQSVPLVADLGRHIWVVWKMTTATRTE